MLTIVTIVVSPCVQRFYLRHERTDLWLTVLKTAKNTPYATLRELSLCVAHFSEDNYHSGRVAVRESLKSTAVSSPAELTRADKDVSANKHIVRVVIRESTKQKFHRDVTVFLERLQ